MGEAQPCLSSTLPEVAGVMTARRGRADRSTRSRRCSCPTATSRGCPGGHTDPWNLVEAAMALDVGGRFAEAERAYEWLARMQHDAGCWHAYYVGDDVKEHTLDTNVTCYVANGVWHHYLCTRDAGFLEAMFPVVERAIDFALDHQHPTGEIEWDADPDARRRQGRAAHRIVVASTRRCAARSRPPNASAATVPTGSSRSARSPSRSRTGPSASSTRNAGRWTGTTRSSAACCAATPPKPGSRRSGTRSSSPGAACAASPTSRGSPPPRRASS